MKRQLVCFIVSLSMLAMSAISAAGTTDTNARIINQTMEETSRGSDWQQIAKITASDASPEHIFGYAVDLDGNKVIAGAPGETSPDTEAANLFWKPIPQTPQLSIILKGGFGLTIRVDNRGSVNATNVNVTCTVSGGLILFGKYTQQTITNIGVNQTNTFKTTIIGLGTTSMKVSAVCNEGTSAERTINATVFLIFVIGVT